MKTIIYDIIGIGIGPFNLGMAALGAELPELKMLFFDKNESFNWHPGMMLEGTRLQVPFHADLVTQVNPQSPYSFLSYLKAKKRLYRFTILEEYFPLRKEYNDYCGWVSQQLNNLRFGYRCDNIIYDKIRKCYAVSVVRQSDRALFVFYALHIVLGIGTVPYMPFRLPDDASVFHSSEYLFRKSAIDKAGHITIIGSGQSAAEIFSDLMDVCVSENKKLSWYTRSERFYPMDYSKFSLEMTSPDYIDHFYGLPDEGKKLLLQRQNVLYKGMNCSLIADIYNRLYAYSLDENSKDRFLLRPNCRWKDVSINNHHIICQFEHRETGSVIHHQTDVLICATGYVYQIPACSAPIKHRILWDRESRYQVKRNYSIDEENTIFVQNAEMHTHGFNAPDLGMGPYRNAIIMNTILGYTYFQTESEVPFQTF